MPPELFFVPPMECKEVKHATEIPRGPQWLHEAKFDGYRCIVVKQCGEVSLYSRPGNSFDQRFPNIAEALLRLKAKQFILDGEIVALDEDGRTNFNALQRARRGPLKVHYFVFDLLHFEGKHLMKLPLEERRAMLEKHLVPQFSGYLHFSSELVGEVDLLLQKIREFGFEGLIAKRRDSIYLPGARPGTWIKKKEKQRGTFIVGGYIGENKVEELIVGAEQNGKLVFVASLGNGFIPATRRQVYNVLKSLRTDHCPFANVPEKKGRGHMDVEKMQEATWVKPKLKCEAAFNEFTPDGHLRHGQFVRLLG